MVTVEVFDPAMCCSTGVCGPTVDPALARFASDLDWLGEQGAQVRRYNLGQEPGAFADNEAVRTLLHDKGEDVLPVVLVDGQVQATGSFPSRDELVGIAGLAGVPVSEPAVSTELIAELAAIGAAVGSNCEPCFKYHYNAARKLGLTNEQLAVAVRTAQMVKDTPAGKMLDLAAKLLHVDRSELGGAASDDADGDACCGPDAAEASELPMAGAGAASESGGCC
ncbi:MAG: arsenite efflux transporter metallochaperone ArsD [Nitriliruptoraceae bacterium]